MLEQTPPRATRKVRHTSINDLVAAGYELSPEQVRLAIGGQAGRLTVGAAPSYDGNGNQFDSCTNPE